MNKTIALVGNPNVGKSVIFNRLTGRYAVVSNYPGTTVDISRGVAVIGGKNYQVIDTPGTNSLVPVSEDEQVTRDLLLREKPDLIVQVSDAKNLLRALTLTQELLELHIPLILVLNMYDEARERGIRIDIAALGKRLGITVVKAVGIEGEGMPDLRKLIAAAPPKSGPAAPPALSGAPGNMALLHHRAAEIVAAVQSVKSGGAGKSWLPALGQASMRPFPGYLIVALALFVMYEFVGVFAAGTVVDLLQNALFNDRINPLFHDLIYRLFSWQLARDFLVGPYGMITMALTYAFAIVFPIVSAFFVFFGLLEDSGYLPRLSVMLDRAFRSFGLNGKAVLPMVLGLGCGTMAALSSRILETRKERVIVLLLLSLTIPCSAQLGVILGIVSGLSWKVTVLWVSSILVSLFLAGIAANRVLPGKQSPFIFEIPPLRRPSLGNIVMKVKMRLVWYMKEAVPLFVLGTALLFVMDKTGLLVAIEKGAAPLVVNILGLPAEVTRTFLLGFLRRDYGAAGLLVMAQDGQLNSAQVLVSIIAITLFVPCIAQCFMVVREQGWKVAAVIFVGVSLYALVFAGTVGMIVRGFHIL